MSKYQVIVGNIGTVYDGDDKQVAFSEYEEFVKMSKYDYCKAAGEDVTLMEDGEIAKEHNTGVHLYECPECKHKMEDIGDRIFQCPHCDEELSKGELDRHLLLDVAYQCREALKLFDLSFSSYDFLKEKLNTIIKITER